MSDARALGRSGEEAAVNYLRKKKFKVVCRGFRFHKGEIDVIAYDKDILVFVEVKTRRSPDFG
ncbi:MAG TPA: YraN family protein, partial [Candidatus Aminicenantes bacterium]|nr:YraN family protein [Candidatus Aminicenantes bacterium]